jgi:hypothetical protein
MTIVCHLRETVDRLPVESFPIPNAAFANVIEMIEFVEITKARPALRAKLICHIPMTAAT